MARVLRTKKFVGMTLVALLVGLGIGQAMLDRTSAQAKQAPKFEVDPFWPKPMPNNWVLGQTIGLTVDDRDHVWLIHRGNDPGTAGLDRTELALPAPGSPRVSECCEAAPPVLEFDAEGNLVGNWGGPSRTVPTTWPESNHGIVVDHKGFVWIGGNGGNDSHILKFTRDGKFVAQYGKAGARKDPKSPADKPVFAANSNDMDNFGRVAKMFIDPKANEAYVADGYLNHRVAVIDLDSGKIKRMLGRLRQAANRRTARPLQPERIRRRSSSATRCTAPRCRSTAWSTSATARTIACRSSRRKASSSPSTSSHKNTLADGSVWDIAFSKDSAAEVSSTWPMARTSTSASSTASR